MNIIRSFDGDEALELTEVLYNHIRDFLFEEHIIPDGQRPGVISGMRVKVIEMAQIDLTSVGLDKFSCRTIKRGTFTVLCYSYGPILSRKCFYTFTNIAQVSNIYFWWYKSDS